MKKRLIAIALAAAVCMPLTAQADDYGFVDPVVSMQVVPGEPSYAFKVMDPGIMLAANDPCGSCHGADPAMQNANFERISGVVTDNHEPLLSAMTDVPSGVHGGGTRAGITT